MQTSFIRTQKRFTFFCYYFHFSCGKKEANKLLEKFCTLCYILYGIKWIDLLLYQTHSFGACKCLIYVYKELTVLYTCKFWRLCKDREGCEHIRIYRLPIHQHLFIRHHMTDLRLLALIKRHLNISLMHLFGKSKQEDLYWIQTRLMDPRHSAILTRKATSYIHRNNLQIPATLIAVFFFLMAKIGFSLLVVNCYVYHLYES